MNGRAKIVIVAVLIVLIAIGLSYPFGPSNCNGVDCFKIGPFAFPGISGPTGQFYLSVVFPGTIYYTDGTSSSISAAKSVIQSVTAGPSNKTISRVTVSVYILVTSPTSVRVAVSGYISESASRPSSDALGSFYNQVSNATISQTITVAGTPFPLLNLTRSAGDLQAMSDIGSKTSTRFNYNLAGSLKFNIGTPLNRSVASIFAWPNLPTTVTGSGGGGGGGGSCGGTGGRYCITIVGTTPGVAYSWYVLGTFPAFSIASSQSGQGILRRLGIL